MERKKVLRLFNLSDEKQEGQEQSLASSCIAFKESVMTILFGDSTSENYFNVPYDSIETMAIFWNGVEIDTADGGHISLDITKEQYITLLENGSSLDG